MLRGCAHSAELVFTPRPPPHSPTLHYQFLAPTCSAFAETRLEVSGGRAAGDVAVSEEGDEDEENDRRGDGRHHPDHLPINHAGRFGTC